MLKHQPTGNSKQLVLPLGQNKEDSVTRSGAPGNLWGGSPIGAVAVGELDDQGKTSDGIKRITPSLSFPSSDLLLMLSIGPTHQEAKG